MEKKYTVGFDFTTGKKEDLLETVWPASLGIRIIKAEIGLEPTVVNSLTDVRYQTDNPTEFAELLSLAFQYSAGGFICIEPMPKNHVVFHLPMRGGKYGNCPDRKKD